jgi:hypothetical protein
MSLQTFGDPVPRTPFRKVAQPRRGGHRYDLRRRREPSAGQQHRADALRDAVELIVTEDTMQLFIAIRRIAAIVALSSALILTASPVVRAADAPPQETKDGLKLTKQTKTRLVYVKPGATLSQYKRVSILDCYVEFSKDWLNDYNRDQRDPSRRIRDSDLERARTELSAQFKKIFAAELHNKGGYEVVDTAAPDVLVLRPALVNIRVSAPDLMSAGRSVTYVESAGQMTLYLELFDSATSTIIARVMDAQADPNAFRQRASSVTNRAAADRILQGWAKEFRERLDVVRGQP